jgi:hypothetical protein
MIADVPWYVPSRVIQWGLQTPTVIKSPSLQLPVQCSPQCTLKRPSSEPHGATRQQATAETPAKRSAYQILSVTVLFVI